MGIFSKIEFFDKKCRFGTVCFFLKNCEYFWNFSETLLKNCDECEDQIFPPYSCHARYYYESKLSAKKKIRHKIGFENNLLSFCNFVQSLLLLKKKRLLKSYPPFSQLYFFAPSTLYLLKK